MPRWGRVALGLTLTAAAVLPAAGLAWAASSSGRRADAGAVVTAPDPAPARAVGTPLLSARRLPGIVTGRLATKDMLTQLQSLGRDIPPSGCLVVALDGADVFDDGSATAVIPASAMKVLTASVALQVLGRDTRFVTSVVGAPPANGVVHGDLTLVGGGDPLLSTKAYLGSAVNPPQQRPDPATSLEALADAVVAAGVRTVEGGVVGDDSRYDAERYPPSWDAGSRAPSEAGPLSALMVDDGLASITPLKAAADPAAQAATTFASLLRARGVDVRGPARSGVAPAGAATIASVQSAPLKDVVGELLRTSDDNTAELLLKELGHHATGRPGTTADGRAVMQATLQARGVALDGARIVDGSGLSRDNRLTCRALLSVIEREPLDGDVVAGLPVAARTGTLAPVFGANPVAGKLLAKTGTLTGVKALTGLLPVDGGHVLHFAMVLNQPGANLKYGPYWDRLGRALAAYPSKPDLGPYEPLAPAGG